MTHRESTGKHNWSATLWRAWSLSPKGKGIGSLWGWKPGTHLPCPLNQHITQLKGCKAARCSPTAKLTFSEHILKTNHHCGFYFSLLIPFNPDSVFIFLSALSRWGRSLVLLRLTCSSLHTGDKLRSTGCERGPFNPWNFGVHHWGNSKACCKPSG